MPIFKPYYGVNYILCLIYRLFALFTAYCGGNFNIYPDY